MTVDAAKLRADFPEFASNVKYPDAVITFWISIAALMMNPCRWGNLIDVGTELFVAHNIVLEARAKATAATGGIPGVQSGAVASKAVDKVSVGYDAQAGLEMDAGHWNLTEYGTRFLNIARMVGSGGIQIA